MSLRSVPPILRLLLYTTIILAGLCLDLQPDGGFALSAAHAQADQQNTDTPKQNPPSTNQLRPTDKRVIWVTLAAFVAIFAAAMFYMVRLQKRYYSACEKEQQMTLFAQSPAGMPEGTIRAMLAVLIVVLSLFLLGVEFLGLSTREFPQTLTAILGTILGFYFGSRGDGSKNTGLAEQLKTLKDQRDQAQEQQRQGDADSLTGKIKKGLAVTRVVASVLPKSMREKYGGVLGTLEKGVDLVGGLSKGGNTVEAVKTAGKVLESFKQGNPVVDIVGKAISSFTKVLGPAVPAVAIVSAVAFIGTKLVGAAYQRWKARVLHLPFSPVVAPLQEVDADTGFALVGASPILSQVFKDKLLANDRPFIEKVCHDFITSTDLDILWQGYRSEFGQAFENLERFQHGVEELRRLAADNELEQTLAGVSLGQVGDYRSLIKNLDTLYADPAARGDLDALMLSVDALQKSEESPRKVIEKAIEEVSK